MTIDTVIRDFFVSMQTPASNQIFSLVSLSAYLIIVVGLVYFAYKKDRQNFTKFAIGITVLYLLVEFLKFITGRPRPDGSEDNSFPSRHAAFGFFLAAFLPVDKKIKILLYIWAILITISRLALNLHWFTDVIAGLAIGLAFGFLIEKINKKNLEKLLQFVRR